MTNEMLSTLSDTELCLIHELVARRLSPNAEPGADTLTLFTAVSREVARRERASAATRQGAARPLAA